MLVKRNRVSTFAVAVGLAAAFWAHALPAAATPPAGDYKLLFSDEFLSSNVNTTIWDYRTGLRTGLNINAMNAAAAVTTRNGNLVIKASTEKTANGKAYLGGGLISKGLFGYGYYEVRSRPVMEGKGVHSAFWTRGVSEGKYRNTLLEVDSYEIDSGDNMATDNLYIIPNHMGQVEAPWPHRGNIPIAIDAQGWIIDGFDYAPTGITYYDNGKPVAFAQYPDDFPDYPTQQNIFLTALNGVGRVDEDKQPSETLFDYVRYYGRRYPGYNLLPNGGFEYDAVPSQALWPLAWKVDGDAGALAVKSGAAQDGQLYAHLAPKAGQTLGLSQSLQYLMEGDYTLEFWSRGDSLDVSLGQTHGAPKTYHATQSPYWTRTVVPGIHLNGHALTLAFAARGAGTQGVDLDNVRVYAGTPDQAVVVSVDRNPNAPVWRLFKGVSQTFNGDRRFYFFSRILGQGPKVTVRATFTPDRLQSSAPIQRMPQTGQDGWAIGLTQDGSIYCAIGSLNDHKMAIVNAAYKAGQSVTVTCRYDDGTTRVQVDNGPPSLETTAGYGTNDKTAAGLIGATRDRYDATGEVTGKVEGNKRLGDVNYSGAMTNIAIWNSIVP